MKKLLITCATLAMMAMPAYAVEALVVKKPPPPAPKPVAAKVDRSESGSHHPTIQVAGACHKVISMPDNTSQTICSYPEQRDPF